METRNLEELIKDYIAKNEVTNSIEAVIRDAYLAGYKARIKQELILKGLGGNSINQGNKWMKYNFGAYCGGHLNNEAGYYMRFEEANNIPLFRLPTKEEIEYLTRNYIAEVTKNTSCSGWDYNHCVGFKAYHNNPCLIYFYHRTESLKINNIDIREKFPELRDSYACIWLADKVSDENKALAVALPMKFNQHNVHTGSVKYYYGTLLKPIFFEIDKTEKLQTHLIFDTKSIEEQF